MRLLNPLEKTMLLFSLSVLAGMALAQCTPAHGAELTINKAESIEINNKEQLHSDSVLNYPTTALAKSNVGIGVLFFTDVHNHVYNRGFCSCARPFVMRGGVEVSKDTPFSVSGTPIPYSPSPLDWRLLVMGSNLLITGDYHV